MHRRQFILTAAAGSLVPLAGDPLTRVELTGGLAKETVEAPIPGSVWYRADATGAALVYHIEPGSLVKAQYLTADMLIDGSTLVVFNLLLREAGGARTFRYAFGGLTQCSFRIRMPLEVVNQNRWMSDREGAFLKPMSGGDRVDLGKVDQITLAVTRKSDKPARFAMTPLSVAAGPVEKLAKAVLPNGPLLDQFGQSAQWDWPGKTKTADELKARLSAQLENAASQKWPDEFTRWGGWRSKKLTGGAGFFRTHNDGRRWWLVDPDGYAFWSAGLDCVRVDTDARYDGIEQALTWLPDPKGEFAGVFNTSRSLRTEGKLINYLAANVIRAFGEAGWREKWSKIALAEMKRLRFNTVGNWSEWEYAKAAAFPYVRPMNFAARRSGMVYRDFPDVFHADFAKDVAEYAAQLSATKDDPAFIGYFLMNEPTWGFSSETPAAGMLYNTESCASRDELAKFLRGKYASPAALAAGWGSGVTFERVARGKWSGVLPKPALDDLRAFSSRMVGRYFTVLSKTCKQVDPNHLNLGMRWAGPPPEWALEGMQVFDVFSLNCYQENLPRALAEKIHSMVERPVMVGEWHFGALDAGLPASGIGRLRNQTDRGKAYRNYLEDAAADPYCVGVHWFTLYDESALGRFDGENYNIGFLDVCNRPYDEIGRAAVASHERMYQVADGRLEPYHEAIDYLPKLYL